MSNYKGLSILVVDDHSIMCNLIKQCLEEIQVGSYKICNSGEEALKELAVAQSVGNPFNVVLLDWNMPIVSGLTVLKTCRADASYDKTAFIMLTARKEEKDVISALQEGITSYLVKPISQDSVEKHLNKAANWLNERVLDKKSSSKTAAETKPKTPKLTAPAKTAKTKTFEPKKSEESQAKKLLQSEEIKEELQPIVVEGMKDIFSSMFKTNVVPDKVIKEKHKEDLICVAWLYQHNIKIALRFLYSKDLLRPLLLNFYTEDYLNKNSVYEDAASEIVNILSNQVKSFLNEKDFDLQMEQPKADAQCKICAKADSILNVAFTLQEDDHFYVEICSE